MRYMVIFPGLNPRMADEGLALFPLAVAAHRSTLIERTGAEEQDNTYQHDGHARRHRQDKLGEWPMVEEGHIHCREVGERGHDGEEAANHGQEPGHKTDHPRHYAQALHCSPHSRAQATCRTPFEDSNLLPRRHACSIPSPQAHQTAIKWLCIFQNRGDSARGSAGG